ncbi:hypothetical protein EJB05_48311, partial [Eragrostis curvula]
MAVRFLVPLLLFAAAASAASSTSLATNATAGSRVPLSPGSDDVVTFSFTTFDSAFRGGNVTVLGDANINKDALQITPDSLNNASFFLANKTGRVLYSTPFKLWTHEKKGSGKASNVTGGKRVASFSTVFTVNVFRPNGTEPAEGVAFVIAPSADEPPPGSFGGYLGLTNVATDGNATNKIVAVELDTEKQAYDPDDNHMGLDVNSVVSVATTSLRPLGIEISPVEPVKYNVWIDYDGAARRVAVYMAVEGKAKPRRAVLAAPLDLGETVAETSYFGFSAATGRKYQLNCILAWNMTVEKLPSDDDKDRVLKLGLAIGVPVGLVVLTAAAVLAYVYVVKRRRKVHGGGDDSSAITGTMIRSLAGGPREFEYRELRKATNNFDEKMKLGQGGYGVVYRGVVVGDHTCPGGAGSTVEVAVKKFSRASTQGQNDFLAELSIINRLRHKHLVRLCFHTEKATRESDVYAFGAVVLEVVCGRRPRCDIDGGFAFLVDWVWRLHRDGRALEAVDPRLDGAFDREQAERLLLLGLACSHPTPAERPKTPAIQQILLGSVPPPVVPPFKPSFVWPATDGGLDTMSTTAGTTTSQLSLTSASTWSGNFVRGSLGHAFERDASDSMA